VSRVRGMVMFFAARLLTPCRSEHDSTPNTPRRSTTVAPAPPAGGGHHGDAVAQRGFVVGDQGRQFEQRFQVITRSMPCAGRTHPATSSAPAIAPVLPRRRDPVRGRSGRVCKRPRACWRHRRAARHARDDRHRAAFEEQQDRARVADRRPACRSVRRPRCQLRCRPRSAWRSRRRARARATAAHPIMLRRLRHDCERTVP